MKPDFVSAYNNRGIAYHQKGEYDLAIDDYNIAIKPESELSEAFCGRAHVYMIFLWTENLW